MSIWDKKTVFARLYFLLNSEKHCVQAVCICCILVAFVSLSLVLRLLLSLTVYSVALQLNKQIKEKMAISTLTNNSKYLRAQNGHKNTLGRPDTCSKPH